MTMTHESDFFAKVKSTTKKKTFVFVSSEVDKENSELVVLHSNEVSVVH